MRGKDDQTERKTIATIELLIQEGANINQANRYLNTPLHDAVYKTDKIHTIKVLLANRANPNAKNNWRKKPVDDAKSATVAALLTKANPETTPEEKTVLLRRAAEEHNIELLKTLPGDHIDTQDKKKQWNGFTSGNCRRGGEWRR